MSNAKPRPVAEINLEEFERRLRASAGPQAGVEDPLAELTRLVDTIGFDRTPAEKALEASRPPKAEAPPAPPPAPVPPPAPAPAPELRLKPEPAPPEVLIPPPSAHPDVDLSELEAAAARWEAAPPLKDAEPALRPALDAEDLDSLAFDPPPPSHPEAPDVAFAAPPPPARARNWGLKVGGLIGAAAVMVGAVIVYKVGGHSHSGAPPLILASTAPIKVAPPSGETIRTANETGALLTRDTAQPTATPPKLVNPPEAPVDLSARPQPPASASPSPAASADAEVSPVAPSSNTPIVPTPSAVATPVSPVSSDPSRVKTISVRPDGSLIASGYAAADPAPAPVAPAPSPSPAAPDKTVAAATEAEASTPAVALPTKLAPPKTAARVVPKSDTTAPPDAGAGPAPVAPKPKKPKPTPVAETEAKAETKTDDAEAPPAPGGGYAVQLAAPRSESEAKALMRSLPGRYADALSGASLGVRKAERNGEPIYRVRAMGLSKSEAAAMCAKVKSAGGDCYVAKN